ncbi:MULTISPECIES: hypothetical protein [unclassified Lysobacter]|uniref:hypothetical protein n=1 Tax=unclassified Lysobacter TaxID=2635362 RepID=UPI0012F8A974|nr:MULTISPECIES: hypothetical protein [unclassified Lysobacter]
MDARLFIALFAVTFLHSANLSAEEQKYTTVFVNPNCSEDLLGTRMVYEVKEGIRRSTWLRLSDSKGKGEYIIHFMCLPPSKEATRTTIYSAVVTQEAFPHENYLTQVVGLCGMGEENACARTFVASLDEFLVDYQRRQREAEEEADRAIREAIENMRKPSKP